jgi:hypothetical protein
MGDMTHGSTRAEALRAAAAAGAALGAGALVGSWAAPGSTPAEPSLATDVRIFNFLLLLEEAQADFYNSAQERLHAGGELAEFIATVAPQERQHVAFLRTNLGSAAKAPPRFDFAAVTSDAKRFRATAVELEEATAAAYIGQGASLTAQSMSDAARIVAVEARHAAWIRDIAGQIPAPRPADPGRSPAQVLGELRGKGFLR